MVGGRRLVAGAVAVAGFKSRLAVALEDDAGRWRLLESLIYESEVAAQVVEVPAGYETDFASVPRVPVAYLAAGNTAHRAAVVHDWLYSVGTVSRQVADAVFREAAEASGVPAWRRWLLWAGVRIGGASHYGADK